MLFFRKNTKMQESLMGITCVYCGKKYKDRQMNGSVCPRCGHIIKLYDENDDRWNCEYCGLRCSGNNVVCPACGHGKNDSPR